MDDRLEKILRSIPTHEGYSWEELKDELDCDEKNILIGMAWAYDSISDYSAMISDESETIEKIKEELFDANLEEIRLHLICTMSEVIMSFGDCHPIE